MRYCLIQWRSTKGKNSLEYDTMDKFTLGNLYKTFAEVHAEFSELKTLNSISLKRFSIFTISHIKPKPKSVAYEFSCR